MTSTASLAPHTEPAAHMPGVELAALLGDGLHVTKGLAPAEQGVEVVEGRGRTRHGDAPLPRRDDRSPRPFINMATAVTRQGRDGKVLNAGETLDIHQVIAAYTINGARANFLETNRGSISAGKYADLVMLSEDLFRMPAERIKDVRVVLTLVGGREAYRE